MILTRNMFINTIIYLINYSYLNFEADLNLIFVINFSFNVVEFRFSEYKDNASEYSFN